MASADYTTRKDQLEAYFDRTAVHKWQTLTSDAPVGRVRATVRAGRDQMRNNLLDWLPAMLDGSRVLDAGCGTCALSEVAAERGATVVAADVSPRLIRIAKDRLPTELTERMTFHVGDMLDESLGEFDYVVAMDSMIHYGCDHLVDMLATLAPRTREAMLITFAPKTVALTIMHRVGRLIPNLEHKAPAIEPVAEKTLRATIASDARLADWQVESTRPVSSGFYTSTGMRIVRR